MAVAPTSVSPWCRTAVLVRFQGAILLAAVIAVGGTALEGSILDRRRSIGRQHYQLDVLRERVARLRLRTEELGSPSRLAPSAETVQLDPPSPNQPSASLRLSAPFLRSRVALEVGR